MGSDRRLDLADRSFRPEELSALVLRSLKTDAETQLGQRIDEAIITVPAYFSDTQRRATRIAGELAGFKVERLLNEPTAAALAYGLHQAEPESQFLVFDLGGGTFDVSILELFSGPGERRRQSPGWRGFRQRARRCLHGRSRQNGRPAGGRAQPDGYGAIARGGGASQVCAERRFRGHFLI
jgi:molecular chaperone DnaK (HSP70)